MWIPDWRPRHKWLPVTLILLATMLPARSGRAKSTWQSRAALTVDARGELGTGTV